MDWEKKGNGDDSDGPITTKQEYAGPGEPKVLEAELDNQNKLHRGLKARHITMIGMDIDELRVLLS